MEKVLIKPLITEKGSKISDELNQFGFIVARSANKVEIRQAVEKAFGVTVTSVKTMIVPGKKKSRYTKTGGFISGKSSAKKKAIVSLAEGDTIDFYSKI